MSSRFESITSRSFFIFAMRSRAVLLLSLCALSPCDSNTLFMRSSSIFNSTSSPLVILLRLSVPRRRGTDFTDTLVMTRVAAFLLTALALAQGFVLAKPAVRSSTHNSGRGLVDKSRKRDTALFSVTAAAAPQSKVDAAPLGVFPCGDAFDRRVLTLALPAIVNFAILPLVGAVDTFWVGRMKNALALAGQSAANQVFSSTFWILSFLPSVVTPLVAKAVGSGDTASVKDRVGEAMVLGTIMGAIGCIFLSFLPAMQIRLPPAQALLAHAFATKAAGLAARIPESTSKSIPTIAVYGKNDPDFAPKVDDEVSEMNRRFSAVHKAPPLCLDGLGHYPHVENPRAVAKAVLSFVTAGSTA